MKRSVRARGEVRWHDTCKPRKRAGPQEKNGRPVVYGILRGNGARADSVTTPTKDQKGAWRRLSVQGRRRQRSARV
jgi:hypothetical protein